MVYLSKRETERLGQLHSGFPLLYLPQLRRPQALRLMAPWGGWDPGREAGSLSRAGPRQDPGPQTASEADR